MSTRILNFDAVLPNTVHVDINMPDKTIKSFDLKDDIPMPLGVRILQLWQGWEEAIASHTDATAKAELLQTFGTMDEDVAKVVGDIFRHTYPGMADGDVSSILSFAQRFELMKVFFMNLMERFKVPQIASVPTNSEALPAVVDSSTSSSESLPAEILSPSSSSTALDG